MCGGRLTCEGGHEGRVPLLVLAQLHHEEAAERRVERRPTAHVAQRRRAAADPEEREVGRLQGAAPHGDGGRHRSEPNTSRAARPRDARPIPAQLTIG